MRNWKKVLTAIVLTLAVMVLGIGAASTSANASAGKWHKGVPSLVKKHKVWVNPKKSKFGTSNQFYTRNYLSWDYSKLRKWEVVNQEVPYFASDGKYHFSELFINVASFGYDEITHTAYRKVAKNTYEIKLTYKLTSGWPDERFKVKKSGKKVILYKKQLWNHIDPNVGNNRSWKKWKKLGKYEYVKHATVKKVEKRDPLYKK